MIRFPHGVTSQAFASATNFLLLITLARSQGVQQFGWSALTVAIVTAAVGIGRGVFGTSIALAADDTENLRAEGSFGATTGALATAVVMAPWALWALAEGHDLTVMMAVAAPFIVLHDLLRQVCFSADRAVLAMQSDLLRVVLVAIPLAASAMGPVPATVGVGVWWGSAGLAAIYLIVRLRWRAFHGRPLDHWRADAGGRHALLGDALLTQITPVGTSLLVGSALGATALSAFRGGSTLLGPVSILLTAVPLLMMPRIVREGTSTFADVMSRLRRVNVALSIACLTIAASALFVPPSAGELVLGSSWGPTQQILPVMALQFSLQPWTLSVSTGLKLIGRSNLLVGIRLARSIGLILLVGVTAQFGSILTVVITILVFEVIATFGYLAVSHRHRGAPVRSAGRARPSSSVEAP